MTTRTIRLLILLAAVAALAVGDSVNFASVSGYQNLLPVLGGVPTSIQYDVPMLNNPANSATFTYSPGIPPFTVVPICGVGPLGLETDIIAWGGVSGCVGAALDSDGVVGTSDGAYDIAFSKPTSYLQFTFGITSYANPAPLTTDYLLLANFMLAGFSTDTVFNFNAGGQFSYSGPQFDGVQLQFYPVTVIDPANPQPFGQTLIQFANVVDTPEPGAGLLLISGLGSMLGVVGLKRAYRRR